MKVKLKTRNVKENIIKNKTTTKDIDFHEKEKKTKIKQFIMRKY